MSNLPGRMLRPNSQTGGYTLALPTPTTSPIPVFAAELDTGKFVKSILMNRDKTLGKRFYSATAYMSPKKLIEEFAEVYPETGKTAKALGLLHGVFKGILGKTGMSEPIQEEMLQNTRLMNEFGYYGEEKLEASQVISSIVSKIPIILGIRSG